MLDSKIILGTNFNLSDSGPFKHGILSQEWEAWPCGTPVVYPASAEISNKGKATRISTLITPSQGSGGHFRSDIHNYLIQPVDMKPLSENHKSLTVSRLDLGKFDRLREYISDVGGISLVIDYLEGRKHLADDLRGFASKFKTGANFYWHRNSKHFLEDEDDTYVCVLTLLDLPYCIPIFNVRKVDGLGLRLTGATIKHSEKIDHLNHFFQTDVIFSNYQDNVFIVDGTRINRGELKDSLFQEIDRYASMELAIKAKSKLKTSMGPTRMVVKNTHAENYNKATYMTSDGAIGYAEKSKAEYPPPYKTMKVQVDVEASPSQPVWETVKHGEEMKMYHHGEAVPTPKAPQPVLDEDVISASQQINALNLGNDLTVPIDPESAETPTNEELSFTDDEDTDFEELIDEEVEEMLDHAPGGGPSLVDDDPEQVNEAPSLVDDAFDEISELGLDPENPPSVVPNSNGGTVNFGSNSNTFYTTTTGWVSNNDSDE